MQGGNASEEEKHTSVLNSHLVTAFSFACAGPTSFSMYNKAVKNCISERGPYLQLRFSSQLNSRRHYTISTLQETDMVRHNVTVDSHPLLFQNIVPLACSVYCVTYLIKYLFSI